MSIIRPRSEWTSTTEGFNVTLKAGTVEGVAIHYPGIGNVTTAGNSDEWAKAQLRAYRAWHINGRGWPDIGYNVAISQNGTAWWAAGKKKAAHCASTLNPYANAKLFGILLIVGNNERPSGLMVATLNRVIAEVRAMYPGATKILGHREVYGASTACPGDVVVGLIHDGTIRAATPYSPEYVEEIQRLLNELGEDLREDGDLGPLTRAAVERFQDAAGLVVDGDPGPKTLAALRVATTPEEDTMPTIEEIRNVVREEIAAAWAGGITVSGGTDRQWSTTRDIALGLAAEVGAANTASGPRRADDLIAEIHAAVVSEEVPDA